MLARFRRFLRVSLKAKYRFRSMSAFPASTMAASSSTDATPKPQKFDYLLILDFEATCDQGFRQPFPQEIIEFPCVKMSTSTWQVESQFHQYVRPVANPMLTSFCTQLTGIVQDMVDGQPTLDETLKLFDDWLRSERLKPEIRTVADQKSTDERSLSRNSIDHEATWAFVTCGDWDLKSMLRHQCDHFGYQRPDYFRRWINIKKTFFQQAKVFPKGMTQMLESLNLAHEGRHHSGIDDATNIAQIVRVLGLRGVVYDFTSSD